VAVVAEVVVVPVFAFVAAFAFAGAVAVGTTLCAHAIAAHPTTSSIAQSTRVEHIHPRRRTLSPTSSRRAGSRFISRSLNHSLRANAAFLSTFKFASRHLSSTHRPRLSPSRQARHHGLL
jgi:hypothetical protein